MHGRIQPPTQLRAAAEETTLDLLKVQDFVTRRWRVILGVAGIVMLITLAVLLVLKPLYTATAHVLLEPRKERVFGNDSIIPELNLDTSNVDSQISVIKSFNLLLRVVEKQNLDKDAEFGEADSPSVLSRILSALSFSSPRVPDLPPGQTPEKLRAIGRLARALDVQRIGRTYVLAVSVTAETREKSARLTNAVAEAYVDDRLDARYEAAKRASHWLADRMQALRAQVQASEEAVSAFRREHNIVNAVSAGKGSLTDQQLADLNKQLVTARAETAEKKARFDQVQQVQGRGGNLQAIPDVVRSTVIAQLRTQQAEVARREAELAARYNDQHPLLVNARAERRDIERSISAEVQRVLTNIRNDYDVARAREESLQQSLTQLTGTTGVEDSVAVRLRELERVNDANKTLFENFLSRAKLTQEQSSFEEREARIISPAVNPTNPSHPRILLTMALSLAAGLVLGVSGAVALEMLNAGFISARQAEEVLHLPVLSSIPQMSDAERKQQNGTVLDLPTYLQQKPLSRYAEAIRAVRVGVQMADVDNPARCVLVTSSVPQEGKTTTSIAIAYSAVRGGQRVLLIDGDLRHPSVTKFFRLEKEPGLVDLLAGTAQGVIREINGLHVLPAGARSQNPPDLLGSARMRKLLQELSASYDYVLIDSPPIGAVIDSRVLAALADKIVYVVRWRVTPREIVERGLASFTATDKLAGLILNAVDESATPRYGRYSQYGGAYYSKYYQD